MVEEKPVVVGTRKSALALWQTNSVIAALEAVLPGTRFRVETIQTAGDRGVDWSALAGRTGVFVKEIEEALLDGRIDMAVHSLKDMPCDLPGQLALGAILKRADPRDAYLSRGHIPLAELKSGARIGSGSLRRRAQLLRWRGDLVFCEIRGNVDTRIKKLQAGEADAIVLAAAGLKRLGLEAFVTEYLPFEKMLPAPCQGAIAVEQRADDYRIKAILQEIDDGPTRSCMEAERAFLRRLGSPCRVPIGAMATLENGLMTLEAEVLSPGGDRSLRKSASAPREQAVRLGQELAAEFLKTGSDWIRRVIEAYGENH